jgi:hypothetical protein
MERRKSNPQIAQIFAEAETTGQPPSPIHLRESAKSADIRMKTKR